MNVNNVVKRSDLITVNLLLVTVFRFGCKMLSIGMIIGDLRDKAKKLLKLTIKIAAGSCSVAGRQPHSHINCV